MAGDYFKRVSKCSATRFWINNVTGEEADMALEAGAVGCTQNPSYSWKILDGSADAEKAKNLIREYVKEEKCDNEVLVRLQRELVGEIAKHFMPLYESSHANHHFVTIQGDPFQETTGNIVRFARFNREAGANIMAKIPVTPDGIEAIRILAKERVPINATECMAIAQVVDVCEAYVDATKDMDDPAPIYFSLITGIFDEYLHNYVEKEKIDICKDTLWQAGIAVAKKVYAIVNERRYPVGFIGGGARGLHHFTEMVGANANITINWKGTADKLIEMDQPVVCRFLQPTPYSVEDELITKLPEFNRAYFLNGIRPEEYEDYGPVVLFRSSFEKAWTNALNLIAEIRKEG